MKPERRTISNRSPNSSQRLISSLNLCKIGFSLKDQDEPTRRYYSETDFLPLAGSACGFKLWIQLTHYNKFFSLVILASIIL
jgi:hypothetical protein